mgnify:CR=1 FL=1|jgi:hypothetical protein
MKVSFDIQPKQFPNVGFLEIKLFPEAVKFLKECIKNKKGKYKSNLAGNIKGSWELKDKKDWFFNNVLVDCINSYAENFKLKGVVYNQLTKNCGYCLNSMWVNFQKKYEFNPMHTHSGAFSFVIWINIPYDYLKEHSLPFVKEANDQLASDFAFVYNDVLGNIESHTYSLNKNSNGLMLFFPSRLNHLVYPFYTSDKTRISISGNVTLNVKDIR